MEDLKQKLEKEVEALMASHATQMRALEQRHDREKDALRRNATADEAKTQRTLSSSQDAEMKQLLTQQKKDYTRMKDGMRRVGDN